MLRTCMIICFFYSEARVLLPDLGLIYKPDFYSSQDWDLVSFNTEKAQLFK